MGTDWEKNHIFIGETSTGLGTYILTDDGLLILDDTGSDDGPQMRIGSTEGVGVFIQTGGTVRVADTVASGTTNIIVGAEGEGTYIMKGGLLDHSGADTLLVGRNNDNSLDPEHGVFLQSGGTVLAPKFDLGNNDNARGTYHISGGTLITTNAAASSYIGEDNDNRSAFIQTGGMVDLAGGLLMGRLADSGATLTGSDLLLDVSGTGVMNIGGALTVAEAAGVHGAFNLADTAVVSVTGDVVVANAGTGVVNQSGGVLNATANLFLANGATGIGQYNQTDGTVDVGTELTLVTVAGGLGTYDMSGGSLATPTMNIGISAGNALFDWSGGALSIGTMNVDVNGEFNGVDASSDVTIGRLNMLATGALVDMGTNGLSVTDGGTLIGGLIKAGDFNVLSGTFTHLGGAVQLTTSAVSVGNGGTYALGDLFSAGEIVKGATPGNLTINEGGVFIGWTDASTAGINMTGAITNDGKVIADSFGQAERTLDLTSFTAVASTVSNPGATGDAGWYARNRGTLALPPVAIAGAGTYNWGEPQAATTPDLVNSLQLNFTSINTAFNAEISLLSNDDPDVVADLNSDWNWIGVKFLGVWLIEDDSEDVDDFDALDWSVTFRYDYLLLADLLANDPMLKLGDQYGNPYDESDLRVYYYDTILGDWVMLNEDITLELDATNKLIWIPDGAGRGEGMYAIVIPEPGTMALLALGGVGMLLRRRRRKAA